MCTIPFDNSFISSIFRYFYCCSGAVVVLALGCPNKSCSGDFAHFFLQSIIASFLDFTSSLSAVDPTGGGFVSINTHLEIQTSNCESDLRLLFSFASTLNAFAPPINGMFELNAQLKMPRPTTEAVVVKHNFFSAPNTSTSPISSLFVLMRIGKLLRGFVSHFGLIRVDVDVRMLKT